MTGRVKITKMDRLQHKCLDECDAEFPSHIRWEDSADGPFHQFDFALLRYSICPLESDPELYVVGVYELETPLSKHTNELCLNSKTGHVIMPYPLTPEPFVVNSSMKQLASAMITFEEFLCQLNSNCVSRADAIPYWQQLESDLISIDSVAMDNVCSLWGFWIRDYLHDGV